jgi:hypothetical protein
MSTICVAKCLQNQVKNELFSEDINAASAKVKRRNQIQSSLIRRNCLDVFGLLIRLHVYSNQASRRC